VLRKNVAPKGFWGVMQGCMQFTSLLRYIEESLLMEEVVVGFVEDGVGVGVMQRA